MSVSFKEKFKVTHGFDYVKEGKSYLKTEDTEADSTSFVIIK
jgi:hypothetical protein